MQDVFIILSLIMVIDFFFEEWSIDERCLVLISAKTIVRDPHHCEAQTSANTTLVNTTFLLSR